MPPRRHYAFSARHAPFLAALTRQSISVITQR
jgi:hypothetical protein